MKLNKNVTRFASQMQEKLNDRAFKGHQGWHGKSVSWLFDRAHEELKELQDVIVNYEDPESIEEEAADVANFLMMVADNYKRFHS